MKYRKRPVVIDAWLFDKPGSGKALEEMGVGDYNRAKDGRPGYLVIKTLEGNMIASMGDYIIKGVQGEYYPCKPDIFELTYEPVGEART